jgi:hypothetical protein
MTFEVHCPKPVAIGAALLTAVGLFGLFVWPTPYRYDHIDYGRGTSYPVRQNRFTGYTQVLFSGGWETVSEEELGPEELTKLEVHAKLNGAGNNIELDIYNGSRLSLKEVTIEVTVADSSEQLIASNKRYRLTSVSNGSSVLRSFQTGGFLGDLGFRIMPEYTWSFRVIGAKGTRD